MKVQLAMRLLADLMNWDETRATEEFSWLRLMVESKYDHYQGYSPGSRFFVNLLAWIGQFDPPDRETAYSLVRNRLIYVSQREMHHLVALTMPGIQSEMRRQVAGELKIPFYRTWGNTLAEDRLKLLGIRTLYVGLSDGAKIDVFRRENEGGVSNEQVVAASEISEAKWGKLIGELRTRLNNNGLTTADAVFERICLIDDFTASGTTLIRQDNEEWKGKIPTFCDQNIQRLDTHILRGCWVHVHHYLATNAATLNARNIVKKYSGEVKGFNFTLTFSAVLNDEIVINDTSEKELVTLIKKYYDPSVEDSIVGKDIWFGYKRGGLPVILDHNTPNNSLALLWAASTGKRKPPAPRMRPLFSRKKRHADYG